MSHTKSDPQHAASVGRVSPTAPKSKSASVNVWRLLEREPGFNKRVDQGRSELAAGKRVEFEPDDQTR